MTEETSGKWDWDTDGETRWFERLVAGHLEQLWPDDEGTAYFNALEERAGKWQQLAEEMASELRNEPRLIHVVQFPHVQRSRREQAFLDLLAKYDLLREEKA